MEMRVGLRGLTCTPPLRMHHVIALSTPRPPYRITSGGGAKVDFICGPSPRGGFVESIGGRRYVSDSIFILVALLYAFCPTFHPPRWMRPLRYQTP